MDFFSYLVIYLFIAIIYEPMNLQWQCFLQMINTNDEFINSLKLTNENAAEYWGKVFANKDNEVKHTISLVTASGSSSNFTTLVSIFDNSFSKSTKDAFRTEHFSCF